MIKPRPRGAYGRLGRFADFMLTWIGLNLLFGKVILDWLLGAPIGLQWACFGIMGFAALFLEVLEFVPRQEAPQLGLATGETTGDDATNVTFTDTHSGEAVIHNIKND